MAKIDHISYGGTSYEIVPAAGDLRDIVAPEFSDQSSYTSGSYVLKNGVLYSFTADHSGAWTGTDAIEVTVGNELTDLKADLIDTRLTDYTFIDNYYVNTQTYEQAGNNSYSYATIDVSPYKNLHIRTHAYKTAGICFYDADGNGIGHVYPTDTEDNYLFDRLVTLPNGTTTAKITTLKAQKSDFSVWTTPLELYSGIIAELGAVDAKISGKVDKNGENQITAKNADFFYKSPNVANPADFVDGEYVNQVTGAFVANSTMIRTGYVPVTGGQKYCIASITGSTNMYIRYMFYKNDKSYISGSGAYVFLRDINGIVTAPSNAEFIVMSAIGTNFPFMVAASQEPISFEEYGVAYLKPQYLPRGGSNAVINLPDKIYALPDYELNIYFENISEKWEDYEWNCNCSVGMQLKRGYRITPSNADAGTYTLIITATDKDGTITTVSTSLVIASKSAGSGITKKVIVLGDSTTYNGTVIQKLNENFSDDVMSITTLGTMGTAPNNHEGRSGWTLNDYFTKASIAYPAPDPRGTIYNPFYNPTSQTFDAAYYFNNSGIAQPDWFIINVGINDMFSYTSDSSLETQIETCIDYLHSMITSIRGVSTSIKVGICVTIPPNSSQDAFGKAYACGQTRNRYKRNNTLWASAIISEFDGDESNGVYVIPIHTNLDTVWNMGMETLPVNARNTSVTYESPIGNGGVHPVEVGYWQIADVYTAFLKANA